MTFVVSDIPSDADAHSESSGALRDPAAAGESASDDGVSRQGLAEIEPLYRTLFEAAPDAILVIEGGAPTYLFANAAAERLLGYRRDELICLSPADLLDPTEHQRMPEIRRQFEETGVWRGEWLLRRKDGSAVIVEATTTRHEIGGRILYQGLFRDMTTRKQAERALQASEARYRRIVETAQEGIWEIDTELRTTFANTAMARMLGTTVDAMLGTSIFDYMDEEWRTEAAADLERRVRGGVDRREFRLRHTDGSQVWTIVSANPMYDDDGRYVGALALITDISELKRAETVVRASEERFRQFAEQIDQVFWMSDPEKRSILYVSPAYERIWGRPPDSTIADPGAWIEALHPADRERIRHAARTRQITDEYDEEYRVIRPDGAIRWVHDRAFPVHADDGTTYRVLGVATDITERKRAEAALRQSEERLRSVVTNAPLILYAVDRHGTFTLVEGRGLDSLGLRRGEYVGKSVFAIFVDQPRVLRNIRRALEGETFEDCGDVRDMTFQTWYAPVYDDSAAVAGAIGVAVDVTERRRAEDALRKREQEFRSLVEHATDSIIHFDRDGRVLYINPAGERLRGRPASGLIGKTFQETGILAAKVPGWELTLKQVFRTGREVMLEVPGRLPSGEEGLYQARLTPVFGEDGAVESVISIARDISDRKRAQDEQARLFKELLEREERLRVMVGEILDNQADRRRRDRGEAELRLLTPREGEILRHVAAGLTNQQIGRAMGLSAGTVRNHISRMLPKLGAIDRTQAAALAGDWGLLD